MARTLYKKARDDWQNDPDLSTPIMAEDLEHIEQGIYDNSDKMALKEIYHDNAIRLSYDEEQTPENVRSIEAGYKAKATANFSTAIGNQARATAQCATAIGNGAEASAVEAFAIGWGTKAIGVGQFVCGRYNAAGTNYLFIIGGGHSDAERINIHTVDLNGNAWFKGDVANDQYSLNAIGAKLDSVGTTDVTEESTASMSEQVLEVTVPLNTIMYAYGSYMLGGDFLGVINFNGIPPMLFNLQIAALRNGEVSGNAVLINTVPSTAEMFGYKFEGEIEIKTVSSGTDMKAKITFNMGRSVTVQGFTIYRTAGSAVDFSIAQLRADLENSTVTADDLPAYEEVLDILNEETDEE